MLLKSELCACYKWIMAQTATDWTFTETENPCDQWVLPLLVGWLVGPTAPNIGDKYFCICLNFEIYRLLLLSSYQIYKRQILIFIILRSRWMKLFHFTPRKIKWSDHFKTSQNLINPCFRSYRQRFLLVSL